MDKTVGTSPSSDCIHTWTGLRLGITGAGARKPLSLDITVFFGQSPSCGSYQRLVNYLLWEVQYEDIFFQLWKLAKKNGVFQLALLSIFLYLIFSPYFYTVLLFSPFFHHPHYPFAIISWHVLVTYVMWIVDKKREWSGKSADLHCICIKRFLNQTIIWSVFLYSIQKEQKVCFHNKTRGKVGPRLSQLFVQNQSKSNYKRVVFGN